MSLTDFFSSIFGKTNKRKRSRGKRNIKTRQNKKRKVRFMKGGWGGADTPVVPLMKGGMKGVMKGVMKGGWGGAVPPVV